MLAAASSSYCGRAMSRARGAIAVVVGCLFAPPLGAAEPRPVEYLDRGLVALEQQGGVFLSWRMLGTDSRDVAFHLYRNGIQVTASPLAESTNYFDANGKTEDRYAVAVVADGLPSDRSGDVAVWPRKTASDPEAVRRRRAGVPYLEIPLAEPPTERHVAGDMSVGDLDGDGRYEIVFEWEGNEPWIEAVTLEGKQLWRIACGPNTRSNGLCMLVYDFDGDGQAELACKTGPGTRDGLGNFLSKGPAATDDDSVILDNPSKHLVIDQAYITIFKGATGEELTTVHYEPALGARDAMQANWGDTHGYRAASVKAAVLHHKDLGPLLVFTRGIYTRIAMVAYRWDGLEITKVWTFDTRDDAKYAGYEGMGNHSVAVGDVDNDGSDELIYGACAIDHDGTGLYTTGRGHGDTHALADHIPDRPGLEFYQGHENSTYGISMRDAATGEILWEILSKADVGRAWAADVTPSYRGSECTSIISPNLDCRGKPIETTYNPYDSLIYFDGDVQHDIRSRTVIEDGSGKRGRILTGYHFAAADIHSTKHDANLVADILGDWREEVVFRRNDNRALLVFSTWIPTDRKNPTLMHDPVYRMNIVVQNIGYNQPAHVGYCFADGYPDPHVTMVGGRQKATKGPDRAARSLPP
jgi:rhamnogalacturonan endolyase